MASMKNIGFRNYCDSMYHELSSMKTTLLGFVKEIEEMKGPEKDLLRPHISHFHDIVRTIDWKLEIFTKVCPYDWTEYGGDVERTVSVRVEEPSEKMAVAGDLGG